ncbi:MAG: site-2 protease family protein [Acidobacteriota bacterium]
MLIDLLMKVVLYAVPLLLGVICHEVAHGWVAEKRGDPTARALGRISLNPLVHIDIVGTVVLPLLLLVTDAPFLFGWAKPVPVNFDNLRGGRRDMALVAISGPVTNFLLAAASAVLYHLLLFLVQSGAISSGGLADAIVQPVLIMARLSVSFNLVLMAINLMPIPPLDGGRVAMGLLPIRAAAMIERLEPFGMLIVLVLIGTRLWGYILGPVIDVFLRLFLTKWF